ncbi:predicted protein [Sclerotinia sclerotiorum 1980 UF-70]|uniref:Uncharacterized protein n=1 Tax=Sclerotinia sclerotiorum (strain ATCC 18683 / 1980 / Ss-1) TaxID=665079 RepID=A7ECB2_SCLS1|nr:predicted protein [Sclerotinia sclerotiorum 1980 UF-70]EDO00091.1 predicted protein [Sclerotinia sclerotiorum 1980 UF-70]
MVWALGKSKDITCVKIPTSCLEEMQDYPIGHSLGNLMKTLSSNWAMLQSPERRRWLKGLHLQHPI